MLRTHAGNPSLFSVFATCVYLAGARWLVGQHGHGTAGRRAALCGAAAPQPLGRPLLLGGAAAFCPSMRPPARIVLYGTAAKVADRVQYQRELSSMLSALLGSTVGTAEARCA